MKWFKHFSMASADDKLVSIRSKFGMWGMGAYWALVERVAEQMKGGGSQPEASILITEFCSFLGCKRNKLRTFLKHLQNVRGMTYELNGEILKIRIPKLSVLADNYTKYNGLSSKTLQRQKEVSLKQEVEVDVEEEVDKIKSDGKVKSEKLRGAIFPKKRLLKD